MRLSLVLPYALVVSASVASAQTNLVSNPGFESGDEDWSLCGSAEIVDTQDPATTERMVRSGRYALRLSPEADCRFFQDGTAQQQVSVPSDAPAVTVSFWYSRVGNSGGDLGPRFDDRALGVPTVDAANLPGWHLYRAVLKPSEFERVRGQAAGLSLAVYPLLFSSGTPPDEDQPGYYVDDVRLVAADETTAESPRPPELAADGTAPVVYVDAELGGVARMEADGSGRRLVPGLPPDAVLPVWSPDGARIAAVSPGLAGPVGDPVRNPAVVSVVTAVPAGGGTPVEVYRTSGGVGNEPPDGTTPTPALDVRVRAVDWSADGERLVLGVCTRTRFVNGSASDELCSVRTVDVATGEEVSRVEPGFRPNVSPQGVVAFEETQGLNGQPNGIWTAPLTALDGPTLVLPSVMGSLGLSAYEDVWATWAPDGARFATVRDVDGGRWTEGSVSGFYRAGQEIAVHDADGSGSRAVLLVDQGRDPGGLAWSPDGQFLLYTLFFAGPEGETRADVWWLDVADGTTGRLTTNGLSAGSDWRPAPSGGTPTEEPAPPARSALAVYPSPTAGPATVALDLAAPAEVRLAVVDALGREVLVLSEGPRPAGALRVPVSLGGLPAGVYVVTARVGGGAEWLTRPVVVAR